MTGTLDVDALIRDTRRNTGLENFGDERFREPLAVLTEAIVNEADLTEQALTGQRAGLVHTLEIRLRAQQYFDEHSEIAAEHVVPAFVIVGPQRSGTSKLFRLVSADPRWTKLYTWQALNPIPSADTSSATGRILASPRPRLSWSRCGGCSRRTRWMRALQRWKRC